MTRANAPVLAILVSRRADNEASRLEDEPAIKLPEDAFLRDLCTHGSALGLYVYALSVSSAELSTSGIDGYVLEQGRWRKQRCPLPELIYDRALCKRPIERQTRSLLLAQLAERKPFQQLSSSLPDKMTVYGNLYADERLRPLLPPTYPYRDEAQLARLIDLYPQGLFLKPAAGFQGRGALRLTPAGDSLQADGRLLNNVPVSQTFRSFDALSAWTNRFVRSTRYIIQPYLQLTGEDGNAFDIRSLLQKDGNGTWNLTGIAVREGAPGSITANLHGGGTAKSAADRLAQRFGRQLTTQLLSRMERGSMRAAHLLEQHYGRLCELGVDFGIDTSGKLWLLELNGKPGRLSFEHDPARKLTAVTRPLQYARLLAARSGPLRPKSAPASVTLAMLMPIVSTASPNP